MDRLNLSKSEQVQKDTFMALADIAIKERGYMGAIQWAAMVASTEVRDFAAYVKRMQARRETSLEMTPDVANAYNQMPWGAALLAAVMSKGPDGAKAPNAESSGAVN